MAPGPVPGYGPPPHQPPGPAADGDRAPRGQRLASWAIDAGIIIAIVTVLAVVALENLQSSLAMRTGMGVPETVWGLLLSGGDVRAAAEELGTTAWNTVVSAVQRTIIIAIVIEAAYHFVTVAWKGRTVGRLVTSLQVRRADRSKWTMAGGVTTATGPGVGRALVRALATAATSTGLYGLAWMLLVHGRFGAAVLAWMAAVGLLVTNVVLALVGQRRSVSDLVSGTVVVRTLSYAAAVQAAERARVAAQAAAQAGRDQAARVAQSQTVRQVRDTGAQWRDQVSSGEASRRLGKAGMDLANRVKGAYDHRRGEGRKEPPNDLPGPPPPDRPEPPTPQEPPTGPRPD